MRWILFALAPALLVPQAHSQVSQQNCSLANPNSNGIHVAEICWFEFAPPGGPNVPLNGGGTLQAPGTLREYSINIPDGSRLTATARIYGGAANATVLAHSAPTWGESHFSGNSNYYRLPATTKPTLYSATTGANQVVLRLENIRLFNPAGVEVTDLPFEIIMADAESTNQNERLDFGVLSGGTPWAFMEFLGDNTNPSPSRGTPGNLVPAIPSHCWANGAAIGVDCIRLNGVAGNTRAAVYSTSRVVDPANPESAQPFTVTGQLNSAARQGIAVGIRWGSIRLRKTWATPRLAESDQVTYSIVSSNGTVAAQGTTAGAGIAPSAWVSSVALPGNVFTIEEVMVPGAASSLEQYDRRVSCTGQFGTDASTATVILDQVFDPANPPQITVDSDFSQPGFAVTCDLTNQRIATPLIVQKTLATINGQAANVDDVAVIGDILGYRITVRNPSTTVAANLLAGSVVDAIPDGTSRAAATGDFSCLLNTCTNAAARLIPANGQTTLDFFVVVDNPGATQTQINNSVSVAGANCTLPVNNCAVSTPFQFSIVLATDDSATVTSSPTTQLALNVLTGDTLVDSPATVDNVTVSLVANPNNSPALILNPTTGEVSVAADTPAGIYTLAYQICETTVPNNCASAVVTVNVSAGPVNAVHVTTTVPTSPSEQPGGNVLTGDTLGNTPVTVDDVIISVVPNPSNSPELILDPSTGQVTVGAGTPPGVYTLEYQICEINAPSLCDTAIATVNVSAGPLPPSILVPREVDFNVIDQNPPPIDTEISLNGNTPTPWLDLVVTVITPAVPQQPGSPVPSLDPVTGEVTVPGRTPPGTYTIELNACERAIGDANCTTVTVTVVVKSVISAVDQTAPPVRAVQGGQTGNMFNANTLNGQPVNLSDVVVQVTTPAQPLEPGASVPEVDVATGVVIVPPGTPAGTYTISYQMCDRLTPEVCDDAVLTVVVTAAGVPAMPVPVPVNHPVAWVLAGLAVAYSAMRLRRQRNK